MKEGLLVTVSITETETSEDVFPPPPTIVTDYKPAPINFFSKSLYSMRVADRAAVS